MPYLVLFALSGAQAAIDFIDVGTRKWDNERLRCYTILATAACLSPVNRWKEVGSRDIRFLDAACCAKLVRQFVIR